MTEGEVVRICFEQYFALWKNEYIFLIEIKFLYKRNKIGLSDLGAVILQLVGCSFLDVINLFNVTYNS